MNSTEIFLAFVERYVDKDRKSRWAELALKKRGVYDKLIQLERHLDKTCVHVEVSATDLLAAFVVQAHPVWCWDFGNEPMERLDTPAETSKVNPRRAYLAVSKDVSKALYFNGDMDFWICGDWKPSPV